MIKDKYTKLIVSLFLDTIGYLSYLLPGIGEFMDIAWAPVSAYLMTKLYKGNTGKIAAAVSFIEEAAPGLDAIPTFTLMWIYTYALSNNKNEVDDDIDNIREVKRTIDI